MPAIVGSVADGGLLLYETVSRSGKRSFGRPTNPEFLLRPGELLSAAQASARDRIRRSASRRGPERRVQRLAAWRPGLPMRRRPRSEPAATGSRIATLSRTHHETHRRQHRRPGHADARRRQTIDYAGLRRLIDWHIAEGTDCIGVVGTTGESPTVTVEEHCEIIRVAVEHAPGRVPIMAGAGGNSTHEAIELSRYRQEGRRRLHAAGRALLQPAVAGRHLPALPAPSPRPWTSPMVLLQRARPHGGRHAARHGAAGWRRCRGIVGIKEATGNIERAAWLIKQAPRELFRSTPATTAPPSR